MKQFTVDGKRGAYSFILPESVNEISKEYLTKCTKHIEVAPNYALIALVYQDSLAIVLNAPKSKQNQTIQIVPVFVKSGAVEGEFLNNLKLGDKVVVAASDLSLGNHINSPYNEITPSRIISICEGDAHIYKTALSMTTPVCFMEFKIVPINVIHAVINDTTEEVQSELVIKVNNTLEN